MNVQKVEQIFQKYPSIDPQQVVDDGSDQQRFPSPMTFIETELIKNTQRLSKLENDFDLLHKKHNECKIKLVSTSYLTDPRQYTSQYFQKQELQNKISSLDTKMYAIMGTMSDIRKKILMLQSIKRLLQQHRRGHRFSAFFRGFLPSTQPTTQTRPVQGQIDDDATQLQPLKTRRQKIQ